MTQREEREIDLPNNGRTKAQELFDRIFLRCFYRWGEILAFLVVAEKGVPLVADLLESSSRDLVDSLVKDRSLPTFPGNTKEETGQLMAARIVDQTIQDATKSTTGASLVFAHSVLDAVAIDLCRVTAIAAPNDWLNLVRRKKIELGNIRSSSFDGLLRKQLKRYLDELERLSLLKKADTLFSICKPAQLVPHGGAYSYSRDRLDALDSLRHGIVHGEAKGKAFAEAHDDVDYLMKSCLFLISLVSQRYGFKLSPTVAMSGLRGSS